MVNKIHGSGAAGQNTTQNGHNSRRDTNIQGKQGDVNEGYEYERLIPAYFALLLLFDPKVKSFDFELNPSAYKKFDDLLIKIVYKNNKKENYAIQLKHREIGKDRVEADREFTRRDNKNKAKAFNILEYVKEYNHRCKETKDKFILFTNVTFCNLENLRGFETKHPKEPFELDLFNVDNILQFVKVENIEVKCDRFYLIYGQNNVKEIEKKIIRIFKDTFNANDSVAKEYMHFFRQVHTKHFIDTRLTRDAIILNMVKLLVANWTPKSKIRKNFDPKSDLFEKAVRKFHLTILTEFNNDWKITILGDMKQYTEEAQGLKFIQNTEECNENIPQEFLCFLLDKPLYLKITNDQQIHTIKSILPLIHSLEEYQVKLVLVGKNLKNVFEEWKTFTNLKDLENDEIYTKFAKYIKVSIQGREAKSLEELQKKFYLHFDKYISTDIIFNCLNSTLFVGKKLPELQEYFIPKKLLKLNITLDNLKQLYQKHTTIVHCGGNSKEFQQLLLEKNLKIDSVITFIKKFRRNKFKSEPLLVLTDEEFSDQEEDNESDNYLHLQLLHDNNLVWCEKEISTKISIIHKNDVNILFGDSGSGKTTMMKYIARNFPFNYWVVFIPLDEIISDFDNYSDLDEILHNWLDQTKNNNVDKEIIDYFCNNKKIVFIFDGISRLNEEDSRKKVLKIIKELADAGYKIWISCRNNLQNFVENHLRMSLLCYQVDTLRNKDMIEFVKKKMKNTNETKQVENIINYLLLNDSNWNELLKIPLILDMITEDSNILDNLSKFKICTLYAFYFEKKFENLFRKKGLDKSTLGKLSVITDVFQNYFFKGCQIVALQLCLENTIFETLKLKPDQKFLDITKDNDIFGFIKINKDQNVSFEHHSFAEYAAAMWLVENFKNLPDSKKEFIFQNKYENIRRFFDAKLAEDCPLHLAVLNQNLSDVKKYAYLVDETDKGGRTARHLAASLGRKHNILEKNKNISNLVTNTHENIHKQDEILYYLLEQECDCFQKDDLFDSNVLEYADASLCLSSIEKLVQYVKKKKSVWNYLKIFSKNLYSLTFYCVTLGYRSLLEIAIKIKGLEELNKLHKKKPLLHLALENNQPEIAEDLINNGIDLDITDLQENTALHKAATWGHKEIVKLLINKNVDIHCKNNMGTTPLQLAARMGHEDIMTILLQYDANIDEIDNEGKTAFHTAAFLGRTNIVKFLHKSGCNIYCKNKNKKTALHRAAKMGHIQTVKYLISIGLKMETPDRFKSTALHYAASENRQKVVEYLVQNKANIFAKDENNKTPKQLARQKDFMNIVDILQKAEDDSPIKAADYLIVTNVYEAAEEGNLEFIQERLCKSDITEKKKILEKPNENKDTLLHIASSRGHLQFVKFLLDQNISTSTRNKDGRIPLHLASYYGHTEIVKELIPKSNVSATDKWGVTPLHRAIYNGHTEIVKHLLNAGADVNCFTFDGTTPLHSTALGGHLELTKWLIERNADINKTTNRGSTCLHIAVSRRYSEVVKYLVQEKKEILNNLDNSGQSALSIAAHKGYKDIIDILVSGGANINQKDDYGETALDAANNAGRTEIVDHLKQLINNYNDN